VPATSADGLAYELLGPEDAPPLLLIAPLARDRSAWAAVSEAFAESFRCILFDARGTGASPEAPPGALSMRRFAEDAASVLAATGYQSAHVAGWSMGAAVAMTLAATWPERARSLSLYTPWARTDPDVRMALTALRDLAEHAPDLVPVEAATTWLLLSPKAVATIPGLQQAIVDLVRSDAYPSRDAVIGHIDASLAHDALDLLHTITCPSLVVGGAEDRLIHADMARETSKAIRGCRLVMMEGEGASHGLLLERTSEFLDAAIGFLRQVAELPQPR
jgi:pimeloyl-ACP methyl ester carboxylesterase